MAPTIRQLIAAKNRPDTPADIAKREKRIAAGRQAHADTMARFGTITADNIGDALKFQDRRIAELEDR